MSVKVTEDEHHELDKLDDQTRAAAMRRLGDAFGAQSDAIDRREMMQAAIDAAKHEVESQIENADRAGMELLAPEGAFKMRPLSLGVLAILTRIDHPILKGGDDLSFEDLCSMLYVLAGDDLATIVQASFAGGDSIKEAATVWAMEIDVNVMRSMESSLQPMLDAAMDWGAAEDGADDPTKPVQSGSSQ